MKKLPIQVLTALITAAAMMTSGFAVTASAAVIGEELSGTAVVANVSEESYGDYEYTVLKDGTVRIDDYTGSDLNVTIPSAINGKRVREIGTGSFGIGSSGVGRGKSVQSVSIPDTVIKIDDYAFNFCDELKEIKLPDSVEEIGVSAFYGTPWYENLQDEFVIVGKGILIKANTNKSSVVLPDNVTSFEGDIFNNCENITSLTIPDSVTLIHLENDFYVESLTDINVSSGNKNYSSYDGVLYNKDQTEILSCPMGKTSVKISKLIKKIPAWVFSNHGNLKTVSIPDSVTEIAHYAFNYSGLESIAIPDSVTKIGEYAFYRCGDLKSVTLSKSLVKHGYNAFSNCTQLNNVVIPDSLTRIEFNTFGYCTSLSNITIPDTVTTVEEYAFAQTPWLNNFKGDFVTAGSVLIDYKGSKNSVTISNTVTSIAEGAFQGNETVTSVVIPDTLRRTCRLHSSYDLRLQRFICRDVC